MKNVLLIILGCSFWTAAMAQQANEALPAITHLQSINAQWAHYTHIAPAEDIAFGDDNERIQLHLQLVVQTLRAKEVTLSAAAAKQRARLLDTLAQYAAQSIFPVNSFHKERTPYFIDYNNTHCAVGYLIKASGNAALAQQISDEHNYDYIADIQTDGILEWAQEHGFEVAELAWIQPSYPDSRRTVSIGGGVNGEVTGMEEVYIGEQTGILVIGDFDSVGTMYCQGLGFYVDGQWQCLGDGLEGNTEYIEQGYSGDLILCGDYTHNGEQYPVAVYHPTAGWTYPEKPKDVDMVGSTQITAWGIYTTYYFPEDDRSELWKEDSKQDFTHLLDVKGSINDVTSFEKTVNGELSQTLLYGGAFDQIKVSGSDQWIESHSLFFINGVYDEFPEVIPVKEKVQDTVLTLEGDYKVVYIGGTCHRNMNDYRGNCVVKLVDSSFIPVINLNGPDRPFSECPCMVSGLAFSNDGKLIMGGKFTTTSFNTLNFSSSLAEYDPLRELVFSYRNIDGSVNTLARLSDGHMAFGGSFQQGKSHRGWSTLNNLGRTYDEVGIKERSSVMAIYPNPATDALTIALAENEQIHRIRLTTSNGAVVLETLGSSQAQEQLSLQGLPPGMYIAEVSTVKGALITQKLFVR